MLESKSESIPLPNVSTSCLQRVIQFVECNPTLSVQEVGSSQCCEYFKGSSIEELRDLLLAANYMDMSVLLLVAGRSIGEIFRDMSLESLAEQVGFKKQGSGISRKEFMNDLIVHFISQYILCLPILDYAEVWNSITTRTDAAFEKGNCCSLYLRLTLPNDEMVTRGIRKLEVTVDSHDQGWSSYPHNHNTMRGSWTFGEVWVRNSEGEKVYSYTRVYTNIHACKNWKLQSKSFDRYDEIMLYLKPGYSVDLMLVACFPGWVNSTRFAEMKVFFI